MRRAIIATAGTAAALVALLSYKSSDAVTKSAHKVSVGSPSSDTTTGGTGSTTTAPETTTTAGPTKSTTGVRVITGADIDYNYGDIQLRVTLDGTKITSIDVVRNGAADGRSQQINSEAIPILTQEALSAQGLNFDVVSGATFTSEAFAQALQSAIDPSGS
jgi:uncharacterized protein with FMN-binding domain